MVEMTPLEERGITDIGKEFDNFIRSDYLNYIKKGFDRDDNLGAFRGVMLIEGIATVAWGVFAPIYFSIGVIAWPALLVGASIFFVAFVLTTYFYFRYKDNSFKSLCAQDDEITQRLLELSNQGFNLSRYLNSAETKKRIVDFFSSEFGGPGKDKEHLNLNPAALSSFATGIYDRLNGRIVTIASETDIKTFIKSEHRELDSFSKEESYNAIGKEINSFESENQSVMANNIKTLLSTKYGNLSDNLYVNVNEPDAFQRNKKIITVGITNDDPHAPSRDKPIRKNEP